MVKKFFFTCILSFTLIMMYSQVNLVPNPSFETYTSCPSYAAQVYDTGNWYMPTQATSDFFHTCAYATSTPTYYSIWVPNTFAGHQTPVNNGQGYAGFIAFEGPSLAASEWKEYLQTKLSTPLLAGQRYYCSFNVSLANESVYATDVISAYFSQTAISLTTTTHFTFTPHISSPSGVFLSDTMNWTQISGSFIASGGEQYITIGVFKNVVNTSSLVVIPSARDSLAYYFLDEVCLSTSSLTCKVNSTVGIHAEEAETQLFYYSQSSRKLILNNSSEKKLLNITDINGKLVQSSELDNNDDIDISHLSTGCYFVFIVISGNKYVKKIFIE